MAPTRRLLESLRQRQQGNHDPEASLRRHPGTHTKRNHPYPDQPANQDHRLEHGMDPRPERSKTKQPTWTNPIQRVRQRYY